MKQKIKQIVKRLFNRTYINLEKVEQLKQKGIIPFYSLLELNISDGIFNPVVF